MPCPYILEIAFLLMDCITIAPANLMGKHTAFPIKKREAQGGTRQGEGMGALGVPPSAR
jgi:hypothetical protein